MISQLPQAKFSWCSENLTSTEPKHFVNIYLRREDGPPGFGQSCISSHFRFFLKYKLLFSNFDLKKVLIIKRIFKYAVRDCYLVIISFLFYEKNKFMNNKFCRLEC